MNSDMGITRMDPPEEDNTLGCDATRRPESTGGPELQSAERLPLGATGREHNLSKPGKKIG